MLEPTTENMLIGRNVLKYRRILTERHGYRIAVIMNEFGDTAVRANNIHPHDLFDNAEVYSVRILKV